MRDVSEGARRGRRVALDANALSQRGVMHTLRQLGVAGHRTIFVLVFRTALPRDDALPSHPSQGQQRVSTIVDHRRPSRRSRAG